MLRSRRTLSEARDVYVAVKELPDALRRALKQVGYRRADVSVSAATEVQPGSAGGRGRRAFALSVNLLNGHVSEVLQGSWGGPNINSQSPLDDFRSMFKLRPGMAFIRGSEGYKGVFAYITVHPDSLTKMLPGDQDVTPREQAILHWAGYKSGYKKEQFAKYRVKPEEIESLIKRGYMKRNKAGATSRTTKGKNAAARSVDYSTGLPTKYEEKGMLRQRGYLGEAKGLTYKAAQDKILNALESDGWTVKRGLKVPHATKGEVRLWFKKQSIYASSSQVTFQSARSMWVDPKKIASQFTAAQISGLLYKQGKRMADALLDYR